MGTVVRLTLILLVLLLVPGLPIPAAAYHAELVPATKRDAGVDITGTVDIDGTDGSIRVAIRNVSDEQGDSLDSDRLTVHVKVRVNGLRRRVVFPLAVSDGDGQATASLGLGANDQVIVNDIRVRGPSHRTLAGAGLVASPPAARVPPPPPTLDQCPAALQSCVDDLEECSQALQDCEDIN